MRLVFPDEWDIEDLKISFEQEHQRRTPERPPEELDGQGSVYRRLGSGSNAEEQSACETDAAAHGQRLDRLQQPLLPGTLRHRLEEGAAQQGIERHDTQDEGNRFGEFAEHCASLPARKPKGYF